MQINAVNGRIGQKIAEIRKVHGWSQAELADRFGQEMGRSVDATMITRLEQGRRPVAVHELVALGSVLGVSAVELMTVTTEMDDRVQAARVRLDAANFKLEAAQREATAAAEYLGALVDGAKSTSADRLDTLIENAGLIAERASALIEMHGDPVLVDGAPTYRVWSSEVEDASTPAGHDRG